jgi:hypothetical protein
LPLCRSTTSLSVVQWLSCLPLDPGFAGSNPAESNGLLRAIKIRSTTLMEVEVKPSVLCKFLRHVKDPYSIDETLRRKYSRTFLAEFLPASLLGVSAATRADNSDG